MKTCESCRYCVGWVSGLYTEACFAHPPEVFVSLNTKAIRSTHPGICKDDPACGEWAEMDSVIKTSLTRI